MSPLYALALQVVAHAMQHFAAGIILCAISVELVSSFSPSLSLFSVCLFVSVSVSLSASLSLIYLPPPPLSLLCLSSRLTILATHTPPPPSTLAHPISRSLARRVQKASKDEKEKKKGNPHLSGNNALISDLRA